MVEVKPVYVSCSSEDPAFPAFNLVRGALKPSDERKQWLCLSPDEKSAHVLLTYEKAFVISSLEIKNNGSAYVQVEGGLSTEPGRYKILWKSLNLMTPNQSRMDSEADGTYIFLPQDLATSDKDKTWDTLKITCSQPFNKLKKYGLSHVVARSALPVKQETPSSPPHCAANQPGIKVEHDDDGNAFNTRQEEVTHMSSEVSSSGFNDTSSNPLLVPVKQEISTAESCNSTPGRSLEPSSSDPNGQTSNLPSIKREDSLHLSADTLSGEDNNSQDDVQVVSAPLVLPNPVSNAPGNSSPLKRRISYSDSESDYDSDDVQVIKKPTPSNINITYKPFNKLLEGVQIVISGFPNPYRAEIRSRALQMGATYSPYWSENSTHLVCAFLYTPKFRQAAGEGLIVTREWIDQCYLQRKRLPWRRFALNPSERSFGCGGDEIWELQPGNVPSSSSQSDYQVPTSLVNNVGRGAGSGVGCCSNSQGGAQNKSPSANAAHGCEVKKEVPDSAECSPVNQSSLGAVPRHHTSQNTFVLLSGSGVSIKTETSHEPQSVWEGNVDCHQTYSSPHLGAPPTDMPCYVGVERSESRRSQATNSARLLHLNSSPVTTTPVYHGARVENESLRSDVSSASRVETGTDGFAGYYRPISQPHSSSSATYLVPPVIMLPQTLPQYFVPVTQQLQAPIPSRDAFVGRASTHMHGQHVQPRQPSSKTPTDAENPK